MAHHKEGKVETYFKEQVALHKGMTRKVRWLCRRGCPDQFWAIKRNGLAEIKAPGEPLKTHQAREIERLRGKGVIVYVISSYEDVDAFIRSET